MNEGRMEKLVSARLKNLSSHFPACLIENGSFNLELLIALVQEDYRKFKRLVEKLDYLNAAILAKFLDECSSERLAVVFPETKESLMCRQTLMGKVKTFQGKCLKETLIDLDLYSE